MTGWKALLIQAVDIHGQAEVARRLNLNDATVSMARRGIYPASTDNVEAKVLEIFGDKKMEEKIPEGYMKNPKGHLVKIDDISLLDQQRDTFVKEMLGQAQALAAEMAERKRNWLSTIQAHIQLAAEQYHCVVEGANGATTLQSYDGSIRVERQYSRSLTVNERGVIAKELVEKYVRSASDKLDADNKALVRAAFRVDEKGNFSASALLSVARRIKSNSPDWQAALAAINDSVTTEYGDPYVRFYVRDDKGEYNQIPLDFSAV